MLDTTSAAAPGPARVYRVDPANGAVLRVLTTTTALGRSAGMTLRGNGELLIVEGEEGGTGGLYRFSLGELVRIGTTGTGLAGLAPTEGPVCGFADYDGDGDLGDRDIEAFFQCLAGRCCATCFPGGTDMDGDGDAGTDADIEAFFRLMAGVFPC